MQEQKRGSSLKALGTFWAKIFNLAPLAFSLSLLMSTTSCSAQKTVDWKEEVALIDGATMVVARTYVYGGGPREPGGRSMGGSQGDTLDFAAPNGQQIHWENPGYLGPMILDFVDGTPYLVTIPRVVIDYARYQCPGPAYVIFKYLNSWQRIDYKELPKQLENRNLSLGLRDPSRSARIGYLTAAEVKKTFSKYSNVPKFMWKLDINRHSPTPPCPLVSGTGWKRTKNATHINRVVEDAKNANEN